MTQIGMRRLTFLLAADLERRFAEIKAKASGERIAISAQTDITRERAEEIARFVRMDTLVSGRSAVLTHRADMKKPARVRICA